MSCEIKITEDGSTTLYVPELKENYHSIHGAVQESMHVFINAGLDYHSGKQITIFEMGFGTGLNCLLTLLNAKEREITYVTLEKYPLDKETIKVLNYPKILTSANNCRDFFVKIHEAKWSEKVSLNSDFHLIKINSDIKSYTFDQKTDLIYYDAFAPEVQPLLWTESIFSNLFNSLNKGGILVTYCAKGEVRRILQKCGFQVNRLPGPPGKREMLRAVKQ